MLIACYVRVSTADQNPIVTHLDHQLRPVRLGADLSEIDTYRDKSSGIESTEPVFDREAPIWYRRGASARSLQLPERTSAG